MSLIFSLKVDGAIKMFTDGAIYDGDTRVVETACKVVRCQQRAIAFATRGHVETGRFFTDRFVEIGDHVGFDLMVDLLSRFVDSLKPSQFNESTHVELVVAGWSQTQGPRHLYFVTHNHYPNARRLKLTEMEDVISLGPPVTVEEIENALGVDPIAAQSMSQGEVIDTYGINLVEYLRRKPGKGAWQADDAPARYFIGGRCDLTTIVEESASTRTLRVWDDRPGEAINPFSSDGSVTPLVNARKPSQRELSMKALRMKRGARR